MFVIISVDWVAQSGHANVISVKGNMKIALTMDRQIWYNYG
tara:strand:- start:8856 stop:8978 length:123 start_codon:yes stop_codon:yes gene_type:complete